MTLYINQPPPAYKKYQFADFLNLPSQKLAGKSHAVDFFRTMEMPENYPLPRHILLTGDFGTGKSALVAAYVNKARQLDPPVEFAWLSILGLQTAVMFDEQGWQNRFREARRHFFLVVDDVWHDPSDRLRHLERYPLDIIQRDRTALPTIVISSHKNAEFISVWGRDTYDWFDLHLEMGGVRLRHEGSEVEEVF